MPTRSRVALGLGAFAALVLGPVVPLAARADEKRWFEDSDKVFIRQHELFVRISEPDVHLKRARRAFASDNRFNAADELEKAAAGCSYFADRSAGGERAQLEIASRALNKLADQIRRGEVDEITTLDRAIADANRILAGEPPPADVRPAAAGAAPPKPE
jgi:hypothetical protein